MLENFIGAHGGSILLSLGVLGVAWILASWLGGVVHKKLLRNPSLDPKTVPFIARTVSVAIIVLAVVLSLDELGIDVASLIAALGIFGFALAIGLRPTTTNFFAGIMLIILKPYRVGEYIEGERVKGVVETLRLFHTVVITEDGTYVTVPNITMWSRSIKNFSRPRPIRIEMDIVVGRQLPYSDLAPVIDQILREEPNQNTKFNPLITVINTTESSMTIRAAVWCDAEQSWDVRAALSEKLKAGITAAGATVSKIGPPKKEAPKKKTPESAPPPISDDGI